MLKSAAGGAGALCRRIFLTQKTCQVVDKQQTVSTPTLALFCSVQFGSVLFCSAAGSGSDSDSVSDADAAA